jgi:GAF domain-containing protein
VNSAARAANEEQRLEALRLYDLLASTSTPEFDAIARMAQTLCDVPIALVSVVGEHEQLFKSACGLGAITSTPRDVSFCAHALLQKDIFEVADARDDSRFADNPLVTGDPFIRFYAGANICDPQGLPIATLAIIDRAPRRLTKAQRLTLERLAGSVVAKLSTRDS